MDLAAYAGTSAKLKFMFNTVDSYANAYRGWYIDDVNVATSTTPPGGTAKNEGFETGNLGGDREAIGSEAIGSGLSSWRAQ